jgi:hypothetical protein
VTEHFVDGLSSNSARDRERLDHPIVDCWSTSKKDIKKLEDKYDAFVKGEWTRRERTGASAQKFDEAIKKLNVASLVGKLTREQLAALAAAISPDGEVKF